MQKTLNATKTRIPILLALIIVSLTEVIFRIVAFGKAALETANAGEQVTIIAFAALILFFSAKGNDKVSYISCGALIAYFVMDQLFELPGIIGNLIANISEPIIAISISIRLLTMIGIVVMSGLLVEYVNDGSIYNRAYKATYWITIILYVASIALSVSGLVIPVSSAGAFDAAEIAVLKNQNVLIIFNDAARILMVLLFTSFAYDSANRQLKREKLTK